MWLLSRGIILLAMLGIAPFLPAPPGGIQAIGGWHIFSAWDSEFYQQIATSGYGFTDRTFGGNVAFFPLFPLAIHIVMRLGVSVEVAGTLVNNLAFLGALIVLYGWVEQRQGSGAAQWATAVLAWCPFSLFGTVIYTEGLFLLLSTAALRTFDNQHYKWAALWGLLATATRITGLALIPAFLLTAWQEKRSLAAYGASLVSGLGVLGYSLYCWLQFREPLAFLLVQRQEWQPQQDFWGQGWLKMLAQVTIGPANWKSGGIQDPWYPLLFSMICGIAYLLWRSRAKLGSMKTGYSFCFLIVVLWLLAGNPLINTTMVLGGAYLLWYSRHQISRVAIVYGFFTLGIIFSSGRTTSAERYVYGIVSIAIALGVLLARYPRWGYLAIIFFGVLLALFSIRFSQHLWVA
jgi:Gpi18-like mannosyltransferase